MRFQVLTAASMKTTDFWVIAPYSGSPIEVYGRFRGPYRHSSPWWWRHHPPLKRPSTLRDHMSQNSTTSLSLSYESWFNSFTTSECSVVTSEYCWMIINFSYQLLSFWTLSLIYTWILNLYEFCSCRFATSDLFIVAQLPSNTILSFQNIRFLVLNVLWQWFKIISSELQIIIPLQPITRLLKLVPESPT
jgi:hypothetical protein